jgi:hypothetical protein
MQLHGDSFHFPLTFGAADHASLDSSAMAIAKCTAWEKPAGMTLYMERDETKRVSEVCQWIDGLTWRSGLSFLLLFAAVRERATAFDQVSRLESDYVVKCLP